LTLSLEVSIALSERHLIGLSICILNILVMALFLRLVVNTSVGNHFSTSIAHGLFFLVFLIFVCRHWVISITIASIGVETVLYALVLNNVRVIAHWVIIVIGSSSAHAHIVHLIHLLIWACTCISLLHV